MFVRSVQNDRPFSVFNMQTVLVNHGIERLPIVQRQKVRDDYLGEGLYSSSAARKWRIDWPSGS